MGKKTFANDFEAWKADFEWFVIDDIRKLVWLDEFIKNNVGVGLILLTFIAVESLSGYFVGESKSSDEPGKGVADSESRNEFIRKYLPDEYKPHIETIGKLRNALMHDYGLPSKPNVVMFHFSHEPHLVTCEKNGVTSLSFNRSRFAKDFLNAWDKYITELRSDSGLQVKWEKRVNHDRGYLSIVDN